MNGYVANIEEETIENKDYRRVVYTSKQSQLVLMTLKPGEEIGNEVHDGDQFIRIETGTGEALLNNEQKTSVSDGWSMLVPAGVWHNVTNTGSNDLKLYTLYSPPQHLKDTLQSTKADEVEDHFDGQTTE
ncbi:MAG: cupin domain-containing protein [Patescibacteria group bacterium]